MGLAANLGTGWLGVVHKGDCKVEMTEDLHRWILTTGLTWFQRINYVRLIKIMLFFHHEKVVDVYSQILMKHNM